MFPKIGWKPQNGWFTMETPIKIHDLGWGQKKNYIFLETNTHIQVSHPSSTHFQGTTLHVETASALNLCPWLDSLRKCPREGEDPWDWYSYLHGFMKGWFLWEKLLGTYNQSNGSYGNGYEHAYSCWSWFSQLLSVRSSNSLSPVVSFQSLNSVGHFLPQLVLGDKNLTIFSPFLGWGSKMISWEHVFP